MLACEAAHPARGGGVLRFLCRASSGMTPVEPGRGDAVHILPSPAPARLGLPSCGGFVGRLGWRSGVLAKCVSLREQCRTLNRISGRSGLARRVSCVTGAVVSLPAYVSRAIH